MRTGDLALTVLLPHLNRRRLFGFEMAWRNWEERVQGGNQGGLEGIKCRLMSRCLDMHCSFLEKIGKWTSQDSKVPDELAVG